MANINRHVRLSGARSTVRSHHAAPRSALAILAAFAVLVSLGHRPVRILESQPDHGAHESSVEVCCLAAIETQLVGFRRVEDHSVSMLWPIFSDHQKAGDSSGQRRHQRSDEPAQLTTYRPH